MIKHRTSKFSRTLMLLVGLCLIGTAFHVHQLHPDYVLRDLDVSHHLNVDQPDCVACLNLMQAVPVIDGRGDTIRLKSTLILLLADQISQVDSLSDLNNKSPPANC